MTYKVGRRKDKVGKIKYKVGRRKDKANRVK